MAVQVVIRDTRVPGNLRAMKLSPRGWYVQYGSITSSRCSQTVQQAGLHISRVADVIYGKLFRQRQAGRYCGMSALELDNPFWASLCTRHQALALRMNGAARYPAEFAPFLGVASADVDATKAIESLMGPGEALYLLGVVPKVTSGWVIKAHGPLAQMICTTPMPVIDGPKVIELSAAHCEDVLALTALVYPHYFRPCTMELGRYFGIYQDGRLAAIIGERLGMDAYQEISAVCTHSDFSGRGYARRLLARLSNDNLERGRVPFLHVSHQNHRAKRLYEQVGYRHRRNIDFWSLCRA